MRIPLRTDHYAALTFANDQTFSQGVYLPYRRRLQAAPENVSKEQFRGSEEENRDAGHVHAGRGSRLGGEDELC